MENNILCGNELCINQKEGFCIFDCIELDENGSCTTKTNINAETIRELKEKMRKELANT